MYEIKFRWFRNVNTVRLCLQVAHYSVNKAFSLSMRLKTLCATLITEALREKL
jgi:hypothetical protein